MRWYSSSELVALGLWRKWVIRFSWESLLVAVGCCSNGAASGRFSLEALSLADTQRSSLALCGTGKQQPPQDPHSHPDRAKMKVAPRLWFCLLSKTRTTHVAQRNSFSHN
jgi:hypothetical protein